MKEDRIQQKLLHIALTLAIHKYIFVQDSLILAKTQFQDIFTSPYLLPMVHHLLKVLYTTGGVCRHSGGTSSVLLDPVPCSTCISNALPSLHIDGWSTDWLVATIWVFNCRSGICRCSDLFGPIRSHDHDIGHMIVIWVQ